MLNTKAWFITYQPKNINELIFDTEEHKNLITKWIEEKNINGNVLFYGPPGFGKTSTIEIIISELIGHSQDILNVTDKSVAFVRDFIKGWISKSPTKFSKKKIVFIDEMDRMKRDAFNELKLNLMEKYQQNTIFIGSTNYISRIEPAILDRFTYKINMAEKNIDTLFDRILFILDSEGAKYDKELLKEYLLKNKSISIREIINKLEIVYNNNNKEIDFDAINSNISLEEQVINLLMEIVNYILNNKDLSPKDRNMCFNYPSSSGIAVQYSNLYTIVHNNYNINYDYILDRLINEINYIPVKEIIANYSEGLEYKKYPHIHFLGCYYNIIKSLSEIF